MSKQVVQALEDSLQDGTFSEVSQGAIEAHLTGEQTLSFSRLRRFLLGDSLSTDQVEQVLEPLIVHSEQAHRYTDLALLRLGPSRTLDILCRRQMPTRFRGVIEFLRKSDKLPTDQAAWIAARLVQALGRGGASLEAFELLELVSLCGNVSSEDADRVVESLLELDDPSELLRRLVLQQNGVSVLLGSLTAALSSEFLESLWLELKRLQTGSSEELEARTEALILVLLSLERSSEQNAVMDEKLVFLLRDFPQLPATEAFRRDYYLRGLEQLSCRELAEQHELLCAPGLEPLFLKALLREAPSSIQTLVIRHRSFLARPFIVAVEQEELNQASACLTLAESAGLHQPMLFFFAWEVCGLDEEGHAEMNRRFQVVEERRLHVRREGEELNPVAFLRALRTLSLLSNQEWELLEFFIQLKSFPYYDPQRALSDLESLLRRERLKRTGSLTHYLEWASRRKSYQDEFDLGE